jgi:hypothetical protein
MYPSYTNNHRIDITKSISDHDLKHGKSYHVPAGMNSIFFLSSHKPNRSDILNLTAKLSLGEVGIISYYDYKLCDYVVTTVIDSLVHY